MYNSYCQMEVFSRNAITVASPSYCVGKMKKMKTLLLIVIELSILITVLFCICRITRPKPPRLLEYWDGHLYYRKDIEAREQIEKRRQKEWREDFYKEQPCCFRRFINYLRKKRP